mmetsp:Transcript_149475/g.478921  ORF Transcript_149475/g.478921 Transcript_149475/m.478921 type:complete len:217 (-) Transcript_149475:16-666(-)
MLDSSTGCSRCSRLSWLAEVAAASLRLLVRRRSRVCTCRKAPLGASSSSSTTRNAACLSLSRLGGGRLTSSGRKARTTVGPASGTPRSSPPTSRSSPVARWSRRARSPHTWATASRTAWATVTASTCSVWPASRTRELSRKRLRTEREECELHAAKHGRVPTERGIRASGRGPPRDARRGAVRHTFSGAWLLGGAGPLSNIEPHTSQMRHRSRFRV